MKYCTACESELNESEFYSDKRLLSGLSSACKSCLKKRAKKSRLKRRKQIREYMVKWHAKNKASNSITHKKWLSANFSRCKAHQCNAIAKRRFKVLPIPTNDLITLFNSANGKCGYCGTGDYSLGFDHRIPMYSGGEHSISNLIVCCDRCNKTKGKLSEERFKEKCARLNIQLISS